MIASKNASVNKTMLKVGDKKESSTVLANAFWAYFQAPWNIFLKSVTESPFSKTSGLSTKQLSQQVSEGLLQGYEHTLRINSFKSLGFYECTKSYTEALSLI